MFFRGVCGKLRDVDAINPLAGPSGDRDGVNHAAFYALGAHPLRTGTMDL